MDDRLLTAEELAERLGLTVRRVLDLARKGRIPEIRLSQRIRRYDYAEVMEMLKRS